MKCRYYQFQLSKRTYIDTKCVIEKNACQQQQDLLHYEYLLAFVPFLWFLYKKFRYHLWIVDSLMRKIPEKWLSDGHIFMRITDDKNIETCLANLNPKQIITWLTLCDKNFTFIHVSSKHVYLKSIYFLNRKTSQRVNTIILPPTKPHLLTLNSLKPSDAYMRQHTSQHCIDNGLVPCHHLNQCDHIVSASMCQRATKPRKILSIILNVSVCLLTFIRNHW